MIACAPDLSIRSPRRLSLGLPAPSNANRDLLEARARLDHEVVLELSLIAVIDQIDASDRSARNELARKLECRAPVG